MKYTDNQKELLAFLPTELQTTKELTSAAKLILGNIVRWYGTDYAKEHKEFYRTNIMMMEDTGIKTEHSIISGRTLLEMKGYINFTSGKRGEATVYTLSNEVIDILQNSKIAVKKCSNNDVKNAVINCSETENCSEMQNTELQTLINEVKEIKEILQCLTEKIAVINCSETNSKNAVINCSTDTESDKEKENITEVIKEKEFTETQTPSEQSTLYIRNDFDNSEIEVTPETNSLEVNSESDTDNHMTNNTNFSFEFQTEEEVTEVQSSEEVNNEENTDNGIDNNNEIQNNEEMTQTTMSNTDYQLTEEMELWKELMTENPNEIPQTTYNESSVE